jgi:RNA polymerase sigma factor (sigma-70 family)
MDQQEEARSATLAGILARIQAGDAGQRDPALRHQIDQAFSKHVGALRGLVSRELRGLPAQQVEDTVQDVLALAWKQLPQHDGRYFKAWLFAIATRTCANVRRKKRPVPLEGEELLAGTLGETAYAKLRREERERLLLQVSREVLDPQEQEVVYMRYELELPSAEIARLAGLEGPEEVRVVLQRVKRRLERSLEEKLAALGHGHSLLRADEEHHSSG